MKSTGGAPDPEDRSPGGGGALSYLEGKGGDPLLWMRTPPGKAQFRGAVGELGRLLTDQRGVRTRGMPDPRKGEHGGPPGEPTNTKKEEMERGP